MAIARGVITDADRNFTESWENIATYSNVVIRLNTRGDEVQETIVGRRTFLITSEERMITSDRILSDKDDPFLNGCFRPVNVPESINIQSNPNALSDEEILKIFEASDFAFSEWLGTLDSPQTLSRMIDLAPTADISLRRFKLIQERLHVVKPQTRLETKDPALANFLSDRPNSGSTPGGTASNGGANPRRQGGMSSDYRG